MKHRVSSSP